jgi:hypothetical protein
VTKPNRSICDLALFVFIKKTNPYNKLCFGGETQQIPKHYRISSIVNDIPIDCWIKLVLLVILNENTGKGDFL